jgi:diamine N-acetyltransferase
MTIIRDAIIEDISLIRQLAHDIWPDAYGQIIAKEQLDYMLDLIYSEVALEKQMREGHRFLILEVGGVPKGFCDFGEIEVADTFKLHKLYVLPAGQGSGFGRQLLTQVINLVTTLEAKALQLNVNRNNKAKHFYEKMGFRVIGEEDIDIGRGYYMNDYVMQYDI